MTITNFILIALPTLIWSSTWFVIKFQIGTVDPLVSVIYRYALAGLLMLFFCWMNKRKLNYSLKIHGLFVLEGLFLFGLNYWLIYMAELHLTSGLIAVVFSLIVFFNILFARLFLKRKIRYLVLLAGLLGVAGIWLMFKREVATFSMSDQSFVALVLCFLSLVFASLGNIIAARLNELKVQVVESNTFGMLYGALAMFLISLVLGKQFNFEWSFNYIASLSYLVLFGSIIAFTAYIKTLVRIGPDRAAYALVTIPILSMLISSFFERYVWTISSFMGIALIILGNILVIKVKQTS